MSLTASALLNRLVTRAKLRHMRAILALSELRSMGRAAQAMGMTQPAMSQLVAEMEKLMETRLLLRHSRGVDLTPAALDLLPIARRMLQAAEEGAEKIVSHMRREGGVVRVASTAAATGALLDPALPVFGMTHPNILIQIDTVIGQSLDAAFTDDSYDVICCRQREVLPDGWDFKQLYRDEMVVMADPSHPLSRQASVSLDDLAQATWLQHTAISLARDHFDQLRQRMGWDRLRLVHVAARSPVVSWTMLRGGQLISLMPRSVVEPWIKAGLLSELEMGLGLDLAPIGYHWRPDRAGPAARRFFDTLEQAADPITGETGT